MIEINVTRSCFVLFEILKPKVVVLGKCFRNEKYRKFSLRNWKRPFKSRVKMTVKKANCSTLQIMVFHRKEARLIFVRDQRRRFWFLRLHSKNSRSRKQTSHMVTIKDAIERFTFFKNQKNQRRNIKPNHFRIIRNYANSIQTFVECHCTAPNSSKRYIEKIKNTNSWRTNVSKLPKTEDTFGLGLFKGQTQQFLAGIRPLNCNLDIPRCKRVDDSWHVENSKFSRWFHKLKANCSRKECKRGNAVPPLLAKSVALAMKK